MPTVNSSLGATLAIWVFTPGVKSCGARPTAVGAVSRAVKRAVRARLQSSPGQLLSSPNSSGLTPGVIRVNMPTGASLISLIIRIWLQKNKCCLLPFPQYYFTEFVHGTLNQRTWFNSHAASLWLSST